MARATNAPASRQRRRRTLKQASGFYGARSKLYRTATESVDRAMQMSYEHRKLKKREYRGLWIQRLSAACMQHQLTYSQLINGLKRAQIGLNRKMLSEIAIHDPQGFAAIVGKAKAALQ